MAEVRTVEAPLWLNGEYFKVRGLFAVLLWRSATSRCLRS